MREDDRRGKDKGMRRKKKKIVMERISRQNHL
jgi:hypothetical protein